MIENNKKLEAVANNKRTWYSPVAEIYYEARPSYPQVLINFAIANVHLDSNSEILEKRKILQNFKQNLLDSGYFRDCIEQQVSCQVTYTIEQYLNLLNTLRRIEPHLQQLLFPELRECLLELGNSVELSFLSAVHIAQKK